MIGTVKHEGGKAQTNRQQTQVITTSPPSPAEELARAGCAVRPRAQIRGGTWNRAIISHPLDCRRAKPWGVAGAGDNLSSFPVPIFPGTTPTSFPRSECSGPCRAEYAGARKRHAKTLLKDPLDRGPMGRDPRLSQCSFYVSSGKKSTLIPQILLIFWRTVVAAPPARAATSLMPNAGVICLLFGTAVLLQETGRVLRTGSRPSRRA